VLDLTESIVAILLLVVLLFGTYWRAYYKGYKRGATAVLNQWKNTLKESGEEENE
jgi:mannose/fructose/N-acetylgalactosamine-specific phosphotransferase system component IID